MPMMWNGRLGFWGRCVGFFKLRVKDPQFMTIWLKNRSQRCRCWFVWYLRSSLASGLEWQLYRERAQQSNFERM